MGVNDNLSVSLKQGEDGLHSFFKNVISESKQNSSSRQH